MTGSVLAFDLGGTRLKAGVANPSSGRVEHFLTRQLPQDFDAALDTLLKTARELPRSDDAGTALCVPGLVDEGGIVVSLPGKFPGIEGFDLPGLMHGELGLECIVVNDAVAYGAGEAAFGAGRDFDRAVVVTIGTGVGVTVFDRGRPVGKGVFGGGILGGQIPISERAEGHVDTSGRPDTIEALCRAQRIVDYANEAGGSYSEVAGVYEDAIRGAPPAVAGLSNYRAHLTRALTALAHAHAPGVIIVGGGPLTKEAPILEGVEEVVNSRLFGSYRVRVTRAELGDTAALSGLARIFVHSSR